MNFTQEQLTKAKAAKSAEELLALAKAEGVALTAEEAVKYFTDLHKEGELSEDELDNVAGGGCGDDNPPESGFKKGDWIGASFLQGYHYKVLSVTWTGSTYSYYCLLVMEKYDGTANKTNFTLYESEMTGYVKENYANAELYADIT